MQSNIKLYFRGTPRPKVFPITKDGGRTYESEQRFSRKICSENTDGQKRQHTSGELLQDGKDGQLHYLGGIEGKRDKWLKDGKDNSRNFSQGQRVYGTKGISSTLAGNVGGMGAKTGLYAIPVLTPDRAEKRQNGRRFKTNGEPAFTLTEQDIHGVMTSNTKIRRLTPTECERLQGFPDNFSKYGVDKDGNQVEISDTQRYKCLGNAVTTNVVEFIGRKLLYES